MPRLEVADVKHLLAISIAVLLGVNLGVPALAVAQGPPDCLGPSSTSGRQDGQSPGLIIAIDNAPCFVPAVQIGKEFIIGAPEDPGRPFDFVLPGVGRVQISGALNPEPSIAYGVAVIDFGAPSSFAFLFSTPIVPVVAPSVVTASLVGGLTDFTGDGLAITPTAAFMQVSEVGLPLTNMGVDVGAAFAAGPGAPGAFYAYGPFAAGPQGGPGPGPWTSLQVTLAFGLSGGGDVASLTGFASINNAPVPEPGALLLLGSALAGLGAVAAWRSRRLQ